MLKPQIDSLKIKIIYCKIFIELESELLADVNAFLRLGIGDVGRLEHIKSMLQNDRDLYTSDKKYLENLKNIHVDNTHKHTTQNPDNDASIKDDPVKSSKPQNETCAFEDKNTTDQPRQSSAAWYLLPIFFSIIGGIISYSSLRKQDPSRARKTLILGIILSIIPIILVAGLLGFVSQEIENTNVSKPDITDEKIKQDAINVPYTSLMEESERYKGEIIQYEGQVLQARDNINSYVLRVDVSDELFGSDAIWSNFDPSTDEEEQLVKELKKQRPFDSDNHTIKIWGVFTGIREYEGLLGHTVTVPEVDVYILEVIESG